MWNTHNGVFGWKRSAIRAQAVYLLHLTMPSATFLWLSDVSVICRVTYFQFTIQSTFFHVGQLGSAAAYWFTYIGHRMLPNIWVGFLYRAYSRGNDFELILVVKMETRHPVEPSFGSEFPAICNHCGDMPWRPEVARRWKFVRNVCVFVWKNDPLR